MGQETSISSSSKGFRVLAVQKDSPGAKAGLVSFFDFILASEDIRFQKDDDTFQKLLNRRKHTKITLSVYNIKACTVREVVLIPTEWKGRGLLGVTIRFDSWEEEDGSYLHVLNVEEKSPSALAGLESDNDYILGTSRQILSSTKDLVYAALDKLDEGSALFLWVFHKKKDTIRKVIVRPNKTWGGNGVLGCDIGEGYLHVLPQECRNSTGRSILVGSSGADGDDR